MTIHACMNEPDGLRRPHNDTYAHTNAHGMIMVEVHKRTVEFIRQYSKVMQYQVEYNTRFAWSELNERGCL